MLKTFYETDNDWIVSETKRLFGIDVCGTCHGQLINAFNKLRTYYMNLEMENKKRKYTPKPEHVGGMFTNGIFALNISDATDEVIEQLLTTEQIKILYDETISDIQQDSSNKGKQSKRKAN
jgi:hypothetical protein